MNRWEQVRGLAGAIMCESRDFGIQWPQQQNLLFEVQMAVDMRVVCPQDVMKMLLRAARMACWKNCADTSPNNEGKEKLCSERRPSGHGHTGTAR